MNISNDCIMGKVIDYEKVLLRKEDFLGSKRRPYYAWQKFPYVIGENIALVVKRKIEDDNDLHKRIKSKYGLNCPSEVTIRKWMEKKCFPLPFLRVLFDYDEMKEMYLSCGGYTNCNHTTFVSFPRTIDELINKKLFYIAGCIIGDGCLENQTTMGVYDGHHEQKELHCSKKFLENIAKIYNEIFHVPVDDMKLFNVGNKYVLQTYNKWLTRFFNYFFGMPYGKKKGVRFEPFAILDRVKKSERSDLEAIFLKGLFDADGHVNSKSRNISLVSQNKELLEITKTFLSGRNIEIGEIGRITNSWRITIPVYGFRGFIETVGFNHPRKKSLAEAHLTKPFRLFEYKGLNNENLIGKYFDFSKIPELRVYGAGKIFREYRELAGLTTWQASEFMGVSQASISEWGNNKKSIPMVKFFEINANLANDKVSFYHRLLNDGVKFGHGWNTNKVILPVECHKNIERLASIMHPTCKHKMRIMKKNKNNVDVFEGMLSSIFKINIHNLNGEYLINSRTIVEFFKTFFRYER